MKARNYQFASTQGEKAKEFKAELVLVAQNGAKRTTSTQISDRTDENLHSVETNIANSKESKSVLTSDRDLSLHEMRSQIESIAIKVEELMIETKIVRDEISA